MSRSKHIPGEAGIWILIFIDLVVFGALFVNYAWTRSRRQIDLSISLTPFDRDLGCLNTILLLTSSWLVALAMAAARGGNIVVARRHILAALTFAMMFVGIKIFEYSEKFAAGITPATSVYFTFFFTLTGLHLFHMAVGMGVLVWMRERMKNISSDRHFEHLESGASFWHMVDLLWIVIFPLIYLM